jgi:hypothetical protein
MLASSTCLTNPTDKQLYHRNTVPHSMAKYMITYFITAELIKRIFVAKPIAVHAVCAFRKCSRP